LLAKLAYEFGQPEYFALAIFGLTMLASIGEGSPIKNLIAWSFWNFNFNYWKRFYDFNR
jgi:putative tricarboxylic transport membrane protein